ncbi:DUF2092 domain-containing protein [Pedosphaera parvula]|uniref:DUF2092 domain-containing protein n=1 Tax=Pedosphaera parvula (strain Ellin514) TaxID=320771 RepID=B9XRP8_PEDPL|nr:DUF2092 domain-containing protein [Pedosphaera parvula]EEF57463.1 conserved hypothetical protein [Pedosphaera parvula Ellin514]
MMINQTAKISAQRVFLVVVVLALSMRGHAQPPALSTNIPGGLPQMSSTNAQPLMEQQALDQLKRMSTTLSATKAFTFNTRSTMEVPAKNGQFVTLFADSQISLQRPNKLRAHVMGELATFDLYYDGTNIVAFAPTNNVYSMTNAPDTIDATLRFVEEKTGIHIPSADIMYSDPYSVLTNGLDSAFVVGTATVDGAPCVHLAFRNPGVNWEIWIETGSSALPRRLVATYTDVQNFPRFMVEFSNWNLHPDLPAGTFTFNPPPGAKQIEFHSPAGQRGP